MKKLFVLLLFISALQFSANAQYYLEFGGGAGAANFLGDIGGTGAEGAQPFVSDMQLSMTRVGFTAFGRYKFNDWLGVNAGLAHGWIQAADSISQNPARYTRNLSFRNQLFELYARAEFYFFRINDVGRTGRYRLDFNAYGYLGAAVFYSNPKTYYNGEWVALAPLQTEGINYSQIQPSIPVGLGMYFTLGRNHRFGWDVGFRYSFSDHIDDVSTTYPEDPAWYTESTPLAVELSNRTDEVSENDPLFLQGATASPGGVRGGSASTDYYVMSFITYSYVLRSKSNFSKSRYNFVTGKVKRRKSRAKF